MRTLLAILALFAAHTVIAEDMQKYLFETRKMIQRKQYEEALKRVLWFHEHALEHDQAMYGVRLSFALADWKDLGNAYPPAKKAMIEVRDKKSALLKEGKGTAQVFHDVVALNDTLEQPAETIRLFEALPENAGNGRDQYWDLVKDSVMDAKRFDIARKHMGSIAAEFDKIKNSREQLRVESKAEPAGAEHLKAYADRSFVNDALQLIEFALGTGDRAAALDVQKKALAIVPIRSLQEAVPPEKEK